MTIAPWASSTRYMQFYRFVSGVASYMLGGLSLSSICLQFVSGIFTKPNAGLAAFTWRGITNETM